MIYHSYIETPIGVLTIKATDKAITHLTFSDELDRSYQDPDPIRDSPKKSGGEYQCPGPHMIMPARAYGDDRFNQYPMTFRAFAICCSHANAWTGVFFLNQLYIANVLQCSQQAVSHHMRKLIDYGYIEKIRNEKPKRNYGKRGAMWRIIYDPEKSLDECIAKQPAQERDPQIEEQIAKNTINEIIDTCRQQLQEYFSQNRTQFDLCLDPVGTDFQKNVWHSLTQIPFGQARCYQDVAHQLDNPKAVRAVGAASGKNPISIIIPCHRVIGKNHSLTGYAGGLVRKSWLLDHEKISYKAANKRQ